MQEKKNKRYPVEYSVVVPVYNSEGTLRELHRRLAAVFAKLRSTWELILVNDCSKDNSWNVMQEIARVESNVTAVTLMNNFGQHNALMCGFSYARGKYAITMDDDLQHPPEEIPELVKKIKEGGYSVVYGQYIKKKHGWFRDFVSKSVNIILSRITGSGYTVTSFRIMEQKVVHELVRFTQYNVMIDVLIKDIVAGSRVGHCMVEHHERTIGKSNYSFKKLFWYAVNMIFSFTIWPLRLATILGFFFSFISMLLGIFFFIYYITYGIGVSGWTSLILSVTFFSGIILFVLGIIGEYVGRIFLDVTHKPQYIVKEAITRKQK